MMDSDSETANPFSTAFWTPGVLPYDFDDKTENAETLLERFFNLRHGVAQLVGPHGSGKTTLLEMLARQCTVKGMNIVSVTLHDGQRRLPPGFRPPQKNAAKNRQTIFFLDGYEQLSVRDKLWLRCQPWNRAAGLLLTTHSPARFVPILTKTAPNVKRFLQITHQLTARAGLSLDDEMLIKMFERHRGNFRNAFLELYDQVNEPGPMDTPVSKPHFVS